MVYGDNLVSDPRIVSVGSRADKLYGEGGDDLIFGQENDDLLNGGKGHDTLDGGEQIDRVEQTVDAAQFRTSR